MIRGTWRRLILRSRAWWRTRRGRESTRARRSVAEWRGGIHVKGAQRGVVTVRGPGRCGRVRECRRGGVRWRGMKMQKGAGGLAQYWYGGASAFILFFVRRRVARSFLQDGCAVRARWCITSVTRGPSREREPVTNFYLADRERNTRRSSTAWRVGRFMRNYFETLILMREISRVFLYGMDDSRRFFLSFLDDLFEKFFKVFTYIIEVIEYYHVLKLMYQLKLNWYYYLW